MASTTTSPPKTASFALAVGEALGDLANPFEYPSVWKRFQTSPLQGIVYRFEGAASASVKVAFADAAALGAGVVADIGMTVAASASLASEYRLTLRRDASAGGVSPVRATLTRSRVEEREFNQALQIKVDVGALTKPVVAAFQRAVKEWDEALAKVQPYLTPGTLLRTRLSAQLSQRVGALIGDPALREAALADLGGALGLGEAKDPALIDWLSSQIAGAIDRGSALADGRVDKAVDRVMAKLVEAVPILAENDPAGDLRVLVREQIETLEGRLKAEAQELLALPKKKLRKRLEEAGATIDDVVFEADDALAPVRKLLADYDKALHDVLAKAEQAAKEKVTARLYAQEARKDSISVEIAGAFVAPDRGAPEVFAALTRGDFAALAGVLAGKVQAPGFELDPASSLTQTSEHRSEQGLEIAFLDFAVGVREIVRGKATVTLDGRGNIVARSEAELVKSVWSPFNTRDVSFVDTHQVVMAAGLEAGRAGDAMAPPPTLEVGIGAVYKEEALEWDDAEEFIRSLTRAGLARPGIADEAAAAFARLKAEGGTITEAAAGLRVKDDRIRDLLQLARRSGERLDDAARLRIVSLAIEALRARGAIGPGEFNRAFAAARGVFMGNPPPRPEAEELLNYRKLIAVFNLPSMREPPVVGEGSNNVPAGATAHAEDYCNFLRWAFMMERLIEMFETLGSIYLSVPGVQGASSGWTAEKYQKAQVRVARASRYWLTVFRTLKAWIWSAEITPVTLAFMNVFSELAAGGGEKPLVTLTLKAEAPNGKVEQLSFH